MKLSFKNTYRLGATLRFAALFVCICIATGCSAIGACSTRECSDDAKITAEVRHLFAQTPELGGLNAINVQTVHGVVYLRGLVSTPYQISAAGSIAGSATGVVDVQNLLTIDNAH